MSHALRPYAHRMTVSPASMVVARIAAFSSPGTERLSRLLGFGIAVIAVTSDPDAHARRLSETWHGALSPRDGGPAPFGISDEPPRAEAFSPLRMDARWMGAWPLPSGTWIEGGALNVSLNPGADVGAFAAAFSAAMEDLAFDRVAARPARIAFRFRTGRPLVVGARYSLSRRHRFMPEMATDIYLFRPRGLKWVVARALDAKTIVGVRAALSTGVRARPSRTPG